MTPNPPKLTEKQAHALHQSSDAGSLTKKGKNWQPGDISTKTIRKLWTIGLLDVDEGAEPPEAAITDAGRRVLVIHQEQQAQAPDTPKLAGAVADVLPVHIPMHEWPRDGLTWAMPYALEVAPWFEIARLLAKVGRLREQFHDAEDGLTEALRKIKRLAGQGKYEASEQQILQVLTMLNGQVVAQVAQGFEYGVCATGKTGVSEFVTDLKIKATVVPLPDENRKRVDVESVQQTTIKSVHKGDPATDKQLGLLLRLGYNVGTDLLGQSDYTKYSAACHANFQFARQQIERALGVGA